MALWPKTQQLFDLLPEGLSLSREQLAQVARVRSAHLPEGVFAAQPGTDDIVRRTEAWLTAWTAASEAAIAAWQSGEEVPDCCTVARLRALTELADH